MVLVDTSVWIRFLANRAPYAAELDRLLSVDEVVGHELVYGELLIGDRGGRRKLLTAYERIHQASFVPHRDVVAFVRLRNLQGRGAGSSTFTSWPLPLSGGYGYGRPTPVSQLWLTNSASPTKSWVRKRGICPELEKHNSSSGPTSSEFATKKAASLRLPPGFRRQAPPQCALLRTTDCLDFQVAPR